MTRARTAVGRPPGRRPAGWNGAGRDGAGWNGAGWNGAGRDGAGRPFDAYALSKLANATFSAALARRLAGTGVTSNAVHPRMVPGSRLAREAPLYQRLGFRLLGLVPSWLTGGQVRSVREGARTSVYVAASGAVTDVTGAYFVDWARRDPAPAANDEAVRTGSGS